MKNKTVMQYGLNLIDIHLTVASLNQNTFLSQSILNTSSKTHYIYMFFVCLFFLLKTQQSCSLTYVS